ncbi:TolB family protein [Bacteroidota bacterium]
MKGNYKTLFLIFVLLFIFLISNNCKRINKYEADSTVIDNIDIPTEDPFPLLKGPYLGQKTPGTSPEMFAPGIVSQFVNELNSCFSPDGNEFYYSKRRGNVEMDIYVMKRINEVWEKPQILSFITEQYNECDPFISRDGQKLFFSSDRPKEEGAEPADWNIWMAERQGDEWTEPKILNFNTGKNEAYPTLAKNGNLYFFAGNYKNSGSFDWDSVDIYCAEFINNQYSTPKKLNDSINSNYNEFDPFIAPDESYIIFTRYIPDDGNYGDLYISFRGKNGKWMNAVNMGPQINSDRIESNALLSPDGKYLFFTSFRRTATERPEINKYLNGLGNIYWIDSKIIEQNNTL